MKKYLFQFPSNGKVFPNCDISVQHLPCKCFNSLQTGRSFRTELKPKRRKTVKVSIPFKREGLSELYNRYLTTICSFKKFQFPSNGKVFPNFKHIPEISLPMKVSIPFKREGLSEPTKSPSAVVYLDNLFQFPSNGKVFPNRAGRTTVCRTGRVSIPFKREGLSEHQGLPRLLPIYICTMGFNSLQTGRSFRTLRGN